MRPSEASGAATPSIPRITYRRDEAAEALGVSVQTVDAWVANGTLRASKPPGVSGKPGRYLIIRAADIETMLIASEVQS
jgi:excisionase family DNA binding protein